MQWSNWHITNTSSSKVMIRGVRGSVGSVFFKFVTEPIGIGFVIIKTDAYRLGLIFRPIAAQLDWLGLIGLVGLI